jgi:hypothetical protein
MLPPVTVHVLSVDHGSVSSIQVVDVRVVVPRYHSTPFVIDRFHFTPSLEMGLSSGIEHHRMVFEFLPP